MGTTPSTAKKQSTSSGIKVGPNGGPCIKTDTNNSETSACCVGDEHEKKLQLRRRLRSKLLAVAALRVTVRVSSVACPEISVSETAVNETGQVAQEDIDVVESREASFVEEDKDDLRSLDILYHPRPDREDLRQFLRRAQRETQECWDDLHQQDVNDAVDDVSSKFSVMPGIRSEDRRNRLNRYDTSSSEIKLPPPLPPVENDIKCDLCGEVAAFNIPCRICTRVFHRECLDKGSQCRNADRIHLDHAQSTKGWSCFNCADLCAVLSTAETAEMMDDFDSCDINRDESITLEEFIRYKTKQYRAMEGQEMPEEDEGLLQAQFARMDVDNSGTVDWWEFMRFEARRYLARKLEEETVKLLTPKELHNARDIYLSLVTGKEPNYSYFQGVYLGTRVRTWEDFLHDQALYILWSRPNRENVIYVS